MTLFEGVIDDYGITVPDVWNDEYIFSKAHAFILFLCGLSKIIIYERQFRFNDLDEDHVADYFNGTSYDFENHENLSSVTYQVYERIEKMAKQVSRTVLNRNIVSITEAENPLIPHYAAKGNVLVIDKNERFVNGRFFLKEEVKQFLFRWWNKGFCESENIQKVKTAVKNYFQFEYITVSIESFNRNNVGRFGNASYLSKKKFGSFHPRVKKCIFFLFYKSISDTFRYYVDNYISDRDSLKDRTVLKLYSIWGEKALRIAHEKLETDENTAFEQASEYFHRCGIPTWEYDVSITPVLLYRATFESLDKKLIPWFNDRSDPETPFREFDFTDLYNSDLPPLSFNFIEDMKFIMKGNAHFFSDVNVRLNLDLFPFLETHVFPKAQWYQDSNNYETRDSVGESFSARKRQRF